MQVQQLPVAGINYVPEMNALVPMMGDWNRNGDPVAIVSYDVDTGAETIHWARQKGDLDLWSHGPYTEAVGSVHYWDGALYVPHVDGAGYWEGCGYSTNQGGTWHNVRLPGQALHVFQMARTPEGWWACGSRIAPDQTTGVAALWFCPGEVPAEEAWTIRLDDPLVGDFSRYYTMTVEGPRVWVQNATGGVAHGLTATTETTSSPPAVDTSYSLESERVTPAGTFRVAGGVLTKQ